MAKTLPSQEELLELLRYEPETGKLFWKMRSRKFFHTDHQWKIWNTQNAGNEAFTTVAKHGHRTGAIFGINYLAHRVIWKMVYGVEPKNIDHIDGDGGKNSLENMRSVTQSINMRNTRRSSRNTSGCMGVYWQEKRKKWMVMIRVAGDLKHLGRFASKDEAVRVRKAAEAANGFHPNHDRVMAA